MPCEMDLVRRFRPARVSRALVLSFIPIMAAPERVGPAQAGADDGAGPIGTLPRPVLAIKAQSVRFCHRLSLAADHVRGGVHASV